MLYSLEFESVQIAPNIATALDLLKYWKPDFALLDINLRDEQSFEIADFLLQENIKFCFSTGFGSDYKIPEAFKNSKILTKPIEQEALTLTVSELLKQ